MSLTISVIVPVFNESRQLPEFLKSLDILTHNHNYQFQIIFVDNNSTDNSLDILKNYITNFNSLGSSCQLISEKLQGKGAAVRKAIPLTTGFYVVIIDADNEYLVQDLFALIEHAEFTLADLVLGSRHSKKNRVRSMDGAKFMSAYFNAGHYFFTGCFNILFKTSLRDPATMWKLFRGEKIRKLKLSGVGFELDWELVAAASKLQFNIGEISATYKSRNFDEGKKIHPIKDPIKWISYFPKLAFRKSGNYLL
jgi:glycosyltransferase involved in cell wall biosynthesis